MSRIFYIMGKSSSGKDTIFKELCSDERLGLHTLIPYTTRPIRSGEKDGVEYFFTDKEGLEKIREEGRLVELRSYQTVYGVWNYFTVDDGQIDLVQYDYLMIGTLESYRAVRDYFGTDKVEPVYIDVDDGIRLQRALDRERMQEKPGYGEMCRRFLADSEDFAEEKIAEAGIKKRFTNLVLEDCIREIRTFIRGNAEGTVGSL